MQANFERGADVDGQAVSISPIYSILYLALVITFPVGIAALVIFGTVNTNLSLPRPVNTEQVSEEPTKSSEQSVPPKSDRAGESKIDG